jgi:hypothetical protein
MSDNETNQDQPKYMTAADLNGALTSYKKDIQKMLQAQAEQTKEFMESVKGAFSPKTESDPIPTKSELANDTSELKKQLKILMERDKQRDEQEKKAKLSNSIRENLHKNGIKGRDELALKFLQDQVSYDEEGQLVMKLETIPGVVETLPLHDAVTKFAQTDSGKFLMDPKDIRGSGARSTNGNFVNNNPPQSTMVNGTPVFKDAKALTAYATSEIAKTNLSR